MKEKKTRVTFKEKSGEEPPVVNDTKTTAVSQVEGANLQPDTNRGQIFSNHRTVHAPTTKGPPPLEAPAKLLSQINRPKVILRRTGSEKSAISNDIILEEEQENDEIESMTPFIVQRLDKTMSKSSLSASRQGSQINPQTERNVNMTEKRYSPAGDDSRVLTPRGLDDNIPDEARDRSKKPLQNVEPEADGMETLPPLNRHSSGSPSSSFGKVGVMYDYNE
ncbi:hypothetical protein CHS0354_030717 [Potamilus streckersoni]|uniref:Uncharacterized protein n=1 Tax=Potamilus streckersoni TaxID=2493646 RepID=A0AAE0SN74_9BIVA|nr:hypothetical protein CHS0354_030717 [Potamilus streckersoni]